MKRSSLLLVVIVALLGLLAALGAQILHGGLSARAKPTHMETMLARNARQLAIPAGARSTPNPVSASAENLRAARLHFADHCATCHANDGSGSTMIGQGLYPHPPDLRANETQLLSDGELFWIIENGVRFTGMPSFSTHGEQDGSWKLVLFIRRLPQLTPDERLEMERYNPKGPDDRLEEKQEEDFLKGGATPQKSESEQHHH